MKRILISILGLVGLLTAPAAFAQNRTGIFGVYDAFDFAYGDQAGVGALQVVSGSTGTGSYTVTVAFGYTVTAAGNKFNPLSVNAPITIGGGTNVETVTPTAVSCSTPAIVNTCQVTATFTYSHGNGDSIRSGSGGLQEAAAYVVGQSSGAVALSPKWFQFEGGHTAGLTALVTYRSIATSTYTVLDYSGVTGSLSYAAASGSVYASTTHVLY